MKCLVTRAFLIGVLAALAGCAATGEERDPRDPFEGLNRGVYRFNDGFDQWVATPVATVYKKAVHQEIRTRAGNFFANPPVIVDFATSRWAVGKVRVAFNKGEPVPSGTLLDVDGKRLVIDAFSMPEATDDEVAEIFDVVESIRFLED